MLPLKRRPRRVVLLAFDLKATNHPFDCDARSLMHIRPPTQFDRPPSSVQERGRVRPVRFSRQPIAWQVPPISNQHQSSFALPHGAQMKRSPIRACGQATKSFRSQYSFIFSKSACAKLPRRRTRTRDDDEGRLGSIRIHYFFFRSDATPRQLRRPSAGAGAASARLQQRLRFRRLSCFCLCRGPVQPPHETPRTRTHDRDPVR